MKTPLDNLKDILSKADALVEADFPQGHEEGKNEEALPKVSSLKSGSEGQAEQHLETAAPGEKSPNYSENIKKLDEILKAYRAKRASLSSVSE